MLILIGNFTSILAILLLSFQITLSLQTEENDTSNNLPEQEASTNQERTTPKFAANVSHDISDNLFIINGLVAFPGEFPYQAYLESAKSVGFATCGGSLVHPFWVLSAAHCIKGTTNSVVGLGGVWKNNLIYSELANLRLMHRFYDPDLLYNDVALLRLPRSALVSPLIGVIGLPPPEFDNLQAGSALASGWGRTISEPNSTTAMNLRKGPMTIVENKVCSDYFREHLVIPSSLCTLDNHLEQITCNGDSGGPLVVNWMGQPALVGVVSFGATADCIPNKPFVFARVSSYREWIDKGIRFGDKLRDYWPMEAVRPMTSVI